MQTETLVPPPYYSFPDQPPPPQSPPPPHAPQPAGRGPTPDPTRSGALWVGGAGVALLLAAAGVLTAVRWDDIGQSVKLGGLVAITLALLAVGQRCRASIPMTAQAIFHLGAFLIPFDMAAVAILAGRSWQETLLLTSVTSVAGWHAINRAVPSTVLRWSAHVATVAAAAGVAAVSPVAMPLALAVVGAGALLLRHPKPAVLWAGLAGLLPLASSTSWPVRIAGAMADLGFDGTDRWQPLAAGLIATATLVGVTRLLPRGELAWTAVVTGLVTLLIALASFSEAPITTMSLATVFLAVEILALFRTRDLLWKPIINVLGASAEVFAGLTTVSFFILSWFVNAPGLFGTPVSLGATAMLLAVSWLTADRRRLSDEVDWLTATMMGSNWFGTTVMFPLAVLSATLIWNAPAAALALVATTLAFWMVVTWRSGAAYGAIALAAIVVDAADQTGMWVELGLGAIIAAVLMLAAQHRIQAKDDLAATLAATAGVFAWIVTGQSAVADFESEWPTLLVLVGLWALSWIAEARGKDRGTHPADWAGRLLAALVVLPALWSSPIVGLVGCALVIGLSAVDRALTRKHTTGQAAQLAKAFSVIGGVALALASIPLVSLLGFPTTTGGAIIAIAGFVLAGVALVSPKAVELPLGVAAAVASAIGLVATLSDGGSLAVALTATGCTAMFVAFAIRDLTVGVVGYVAVSLGVALGLSVLDVTWLEAYLALPAIAALGWGYLYQRKGGSSWAAYAPTIGLMSYIAIADRIGGGSAWHAVIAGGIGVLAVIAGGYRRLAGPLVTGSAVLAVVVVYESLGPAALVPTWAWLAVGGTILLGAGVAMERSDTSPLERGQHIRNVIAAEFS